MSPAIFAALVCFVFWLFSRQIYTWAISHLSPYFGEHGAWAVLFFGIIAVAFALDPRVGWQSRKRQD